MSVKILYFAWMREKAGMGEETIELPEQVASVSDLMDWLGERNEGLKSAFADKERIRVAANQEYVDFDHPVAGTHEIAFFPPVTGG